MQEQELVIPSVLSSFIISLRSLSKVKKIGINNNDILDEILNLRLKNKKLSDLINEQTITETKRILSNNYNNKSKKVYRPIKPIGRSFKLKSTNRKIKKKVSKAFAKIDEKIDSDSPNDSFSEKSNSLDDSVSNRSKTSNKLKTSNKPKDLKLSNTSDRSNSSKSKAFNSLETLNGSYTDSDSDDSSNDSPNISKHSIMMA